ncbi:MAG: hypothetical protein ABEI06_05005 [Halobacteriaceae archaeon]
MDWPVIFIGALIEALIAVVIFYRGPPEILLIFVIPVIGVGLGFFSRNFEHEYMEGILGTIFGVIFTLIGIIIGFWTLDIPLPPVVLANLTYAVIIYGLAGLILFIPVIGLIGAISALFGVRLRKYIST